VNLTSKIAMNTTALAVGRLLLAASGLVAVGISTRYLGVEAYGKFATATALVWLISSFTDLGLSTVGLREVSRRPDETQRLFSTLLTIGLAFTCGALVIGLGLVQLVYPGADDFQVREGVTALLITLPFSAVAGAGTMYLISQQQAYLTMVGSVVASIVTLGTLVIATTLDWGFMGVVAAYVLNGVSFALVMILLARGRLRYRPGLDWPLARQIVKWALPIGATALIVNVYFRIDLILVSLISTDTQVALYGVAYKVFEALSILPGYFIVTVVPELSRAAVEHRERLDELVQKSFTALQTLALAMVIVFAGLADEISEVIGGDAFKHATPVILLLTGAVGISALTFVFGATLIALDRQNSVFKISIVTLATNVLLNLALIPPLGARGAALALLLTEAANLALFVLVYRRCAKLPRLGYAYRRVAAATLGLAAVLGVKLVPAVPALGSFPTLVLGSAVGVFAYVGGLYALRAMPVELHAGLLVPLWGRLRPR
jgi:O-antigen/teichoic acid export membrane protein